LAEGDRLLKAQASRVFAAPLPLTSLADDTAALERTLERIDGAVRAGWPCPMRARHCRDRFREGQGAGLHRRAGSDEGETVSTCSNRAQAAPAGPGVAPDSHGLIWLPEGPFATVFAQHASG